MFVVTVDFEIKPNYEAAFVEAMNNEVYRDADAFEFHLKTDHFLDFDATVRDWTASKTARQWHRISAELAP